MNRRLLGLLLIGAAALLASACSTADVAATVNETAITNEQVTSLHPEPVSVVVDGESFRNDLTILIVTQATVDAAEEQLGVTGTDTTEGRASGQCKVLLKPAHLVLQTDNPTTANAQVTHINVSEQGFRVSLQAINDPEVELHMFHHQELAINQRVTVSIADHCPILF